MDSHVEIQFLNEIFLLHKEYPPAKNDFKPRKKNQSSLIRHEISKFQKISSFCRPVHKLLLATQKFLVHLLLDQLNNLAVDHLLSTSIPVSTGTRFQRTTELTAWSLTLTK